MPVPRRRAVLLALSGLAVALLACQTAPGLEPTPVPTQPPTSPPTAVPPTLLSSRGYTRFTEGDFSVEMPNWPDSGSAEEGVLLSVSNGVSSAWIKAWPLIPRMVVDGVHQWVAGQDTTTLAHEDVEPDRARLELAISEGAATVRMRTLLLYCNAQTYEVTVAAPEADSESTSTLDHVLASVTCTPPGRPPRRESGALGMMVNPPTVGDNPFDLAAYQQSLHIARESGVQVTHFYFEWDEIETAPGVYDWTVPDYIIEANALEGFEMSIVLKTINTTVRGQIPEGIATLPFDDPEFVNQLSAFAAAFADRYAGRVHYLWIGNEVNDYFAAHRDEVDAYAMAFDGTRAAIRARHPDLPVGITFAYHDAETLDTLDVVETLNRGDAIAYTIYLYNDGFRFTRDPAEIGEYLDRMLDLAGDTPVAIVETGWNTASTLESSEEKQAEYIRQTFTALTERSDQIRFLTWFMLNDSTRASCHEQGLTFFPPGTEPDPAEMEVFVTFLCDVGLRRSDGTPKLGWQVWVEEADAWLEP
jgi:hypothetical protein